MERPTLESIFNDAPQQSEGRPSLSDIFSDAPKAAPVAQKVSQGMEPQNILGQAFNVPGAAIRSALMGRGYMQGALNPSKVPTFQNTLLDAYYQKTPNFPGKVALGNVPSALGMAGDVATNPADMAMMLAGKLPGVQNLGKAIRSTKPAQAFEQFLTKDRNVVSHMPKIMNQKWLVDKAVTVKRVVDDTIGGLKKQYGQIFGKNADKVATDVSAISQDYLDEFGLNDKSTIKQIWDARTQLLSDIADSAWENPSYYKYVKPRQNELIETATKMKAVVLNSVDDDARSSILKLDPQFEKAITKGRKLSRMVYDAKAKEYKVKPLIKAIKDPEATDSKGAFDKFKEFSSELKQVEKDIGKYVFRQSVKKTAKRFAPYAIGGGVLGGGLLRRGK